MIGLPFIVLAITFVVTSVCLTFGKNNETSRMYGTMSGIFTITALALILGMNLKRLSVPIQPSVSKPDFSGLIAHSGEPDFSALNDHNDT